MDPLCPDELPAHDDDNGLFHQVQLNLDNHAANSQVWYSLHRIDLAMETFRLLQIVGILRIK